MQPSRAEKEPSTRTERADTQFEMCYNRRAVRPKRENIVNRRLVIGFVVAAVVVALIVVLWSRSDRESDQEEESVRRTEIQRGEMVVSVRATGSIVAKAEAGLGFDLPGRVAKVWVEVGDQVQAGEKLAQVDDTSLTLRVRQAEAGLAAAQAQLDQLQADTRQGELTASAANLEAAQARLDGADANVRELERGADANQVAAAEANLRAAEAGLWLATIQRDQIQRGASEAEVAVAEAQLASALAQQKVARDAHDQTLKCYTVALPNGGEEKICPALGMIEEQARFNLYAADEAVDAARAQLDQLQSGPTEEQSDTADANVAVAAAQRDAAQAQLDLLRAGTSAEQVQAAQANVAALEAQRDATQAQLDLLLAGASEFQIAVAQASVDQAQVALEIAQAELDKAALVAPLDGVVTAVNVQVGQTAPATLPAVTLVDLSELQIVVNVDEIDVAQLAEGQEVTIRVDALPDETVSGYVKHIAPAASQVGGVIVYEVTIVLGATELPLRVGMSATAAIVVERLEDVLLVPNWAIRIDRDTGMTFVNLVHENTVEEIEVEIGVRGEDVSQALSGLQEGDVVVAGDVVGLRNLLERGE
jgi:HlyD family secretion protein